MSNINGIEILSLLAIAIAILILTHILEKGKVVDEIERHRRYRDEL